MLSTLHQHTTLPARQPPTRPPSPAHPPCPAAAARSRVCWCLRGLAGLAVAAQRGEDRYGVVLLCEPTLPAVTAGLLSVVLALQQYVKVGRRGGVFVRACVHGCVRACAGGREGGRGRGPGAAGWGGEQAGRPGRVHCEGRATPPTPATPAAPPPVQAPVHAMGGGAGGAQVAAFARQPSALERLARHAGLVGSGLAGRTTNITLQPVEEVAFALEAAARNCLNRLALAYGEQLRGVLAAAAGGGQAAFKAPHGSPTELAALLGAVLACQDG